MLDPAGRFSRLLDEQDERMYDWFWEHQPNHIYDATEYAIKNILGPSAQHSNNPLKNTDLNVNPTAADTSTHHSHPTKPPPPQQKPHTASNEEEDATVEEAQEAAENAVGSPAGEVNKTNYMTPHSSESEQATDDVRRYKDTLEQEIDAKKLSFDQLANNLSPILDRTTKTTFSPNTARLKEELQNTSEKSNWDESLLHRTVIEEVEIESTPNGNEEKVQYDQQEQTSEDEEDGSLTKEDFLNKGEVTPQKPIKQPKQAPPSAEIGIGSLRPRRAKATSIKKDESKISLTQLFKDKKNGTDKT
jgi:hypothetical protein